MKNLVLLVFLICGIAASTHTWASKRLFVGNLPFATTSAEVGNLAAVYGGVRSIKVRSIDDNGETSAKAVVVFESEESVDAAINDLDGLVYLGNLLTAAKKKPKEIVVVGSKVKEVVRAAGLRSDGDLVQAVSDKVHEILEAAIGWAGSNKRGTVRPYDL